MCVCAVSNEYDKLQFMHLHFIGCNFIASYNFELNPINLQFNFELAILNCYATASKLVQVTILKFNFELQFCKATL